MPRLKWTMVRKASHAGRTGKDVLVIGRPTLREKNGKKNPMIMCSVYTACRGRGPLGGAQILSSARPETEF